MTFDIKRDYTQRSNRFSSVPYKATIRWEYLGSEAAPSGLSFQCTCIASVNSGMPCAHMVVVVLRYRTYTLLQREDVLRTLRLRTLSTIEFFHLYWRRDFTLYRQIMPEIRRQRVRDVPSADEVEDSNDRNDWNLCMERKYRNIIACSNTKAKADCLYQLLRCHGEIAVQALDSCFDNMIECVSAERLPQIAASIAIERSSTVLSNPSEGLLNRSGGRQRMRSSTETVWRREIPRGKQGGISARESHQQCSEP